MPTQQGPTSGGTEQASRGLLTGDCPGLSGTGRACTRGKRHPDGCVDERPAPAAAADQIDGQGGRQGGRQGGGQGVDDARRGCSSTKSHTWPDLVDAPHTGLFDARHWPGRQHAEPEPVRYCTRCAVVLSEGGLFTPDRPGLVPSIEDFLATSTVPGDETSAPQADPGRPRRA